MINHVQLTLTTTCQSMTGGVDAVAGVGEDVLFACGKTEGGFDFNTGDVISVLFTDQATSYQQLIGGGQVTAITPTFCFTDNQKTYVLGGYTAYFSALNEPTQWNDPNGIGNGYIAMQDFYGTQQNLLAAATFQGRIAFFSRFSTQIWATNADPSQWQRLQVLQNTGTVAPLSVQSLSDLDVMYLSDTGIRSLRARETTLNAFVDDLGSPIDTLVTASNGSNSNACGIVEPQSGRYWCWINGLIYVFSRFLANQISAWATYLPTYQTTMTPAVNVYTVTIGRQYYWLKGSNDISITDGTTTWNASGYIVPAATSLTVTVVAGATNGSIYENTPFTPTQFLLQNGQVWCRDANRFYLYGGQNGTSYDYAQGVAATTWLDLTNPGNLKKGTGLDSAFHGYFGFSIGMDQLAGTLKQVYAGTQPTFQKGGMAYSSDGYHVKFQAVTLDNNPATLSSLVFDYKTSVEKEDGH